MTASTPPLWIKICGMRSAEAIEAAASAGADAVGFVFHEPSPRHVVPSEARSLAAAVPQGLEKVAVFLHPTQAMLDEVLAALQPDWVQVDFDDLARLRLDPGTRVLPVFRTGDTDVAGRIERAHCSRVLLESGRSGSGERADWREAAKIAPCVPIVLAGGLDARNVADAIARVRPFGVDVSSGVERSRGEKDVVMIHEFVRTARAAGARPASAPSMGSTDR